MNRQKLLITLLLSLFYIHGITQSHQTDSIMSVLKTSAEDSIKVNTLIALSGSLLQTNASEALVYAQEAKALAEKLDFKRGQAYSLKSIGMCYYFQGNYIETLLYWQQSLNTFQSIGDKLGIANMLSNLGAVNFNKGDDEKAIKYYLESLETSEEIGDKLRIATALINIGAVYFNKENTHELALQYYLKALPISEELGDHDAIGTSAVNIGEIYLARGDDKSALVYFEKALMAYKKSGSGSVSYALYNIGRVYTKRKDYVLSINYQQEAYNLAKTLNRKKEMSQALLGLGEAYRQGGNIKSAILAIKQSESIAQEIGANYELKNAYQSLAEMYNISADYRNAFKYQTLYTEIKDKLYNAEMDKTLQSMTLKFDLEKKQREVDLLEKDKIQKVQESRNQKLLIFSISGALFSVLLFSFIQFRNNQSKQRSNALLKAQKEEIQHTLERLKNTQSQLIQSEKMASLGELTAGIAHEIQNPLNFVINFSEVSNELIEEMNGELDKGEIGEAKIIAADLGEIMGKINLHGKRADSIVKGMLQHSRTSSGQKESININALADEYLRLAYMGLQAKDNSFKTKIETDFDERISKVDIIPQEIGRVLLNLITNAFYAVAEKKKQVGDGYEPVVGVTTKYDGFKVSLSIKDNGTGIPENIREKIFQPFFTTKPTGQGTGLGLSLSYDIIKAHGGELKLETQEGEGSMFIIQLPYS